MARKHYSVDEVLKSLSKKADCKIITDASSYENAFNNTIYILTDTVFSKNHGKIITNPAKKFDLGNGSQGKIGFLVNYCGFKVCKVVEFPKHRNY
jgi:hypothetical protein